MTADIRDRSLIYAITFLRALATGMIGVLLGIYLTKLDFNAAQIGVVISVGLVSAALMTLVATFFGGGLRRRLFLALLATFGAGGGVLAALSTGYEAMIMASLFGMLNGMGKDRGAALVLETAILPSMTPETERTRAFAWYSVFQDSGHALGGVLAGLPALLAQLTKQPEIVNFRVAFLVYSFLLAVTAILYLNLSSKVETQTAGMAKQRISSESKRVLFKISSLFAIDSIAGGFLTAALLSYFFYERFGAGAGQIGLLFFAARTLNAFSHLGAAWLAKKIGLVNTMVFTHMPSSILLLTVAVAPSFTVAAILFLLREAFVEMDVPTRQSYVMAVIKPEERTFASGVTHIVRMAGWAVAPYFAGLFMEGLSLATPVIIGAGMKIVYDFLLYVNFRLLKPPEERPEPASS